MKKIYLQLLFLLLICNKAFCQIPITSIKDYKVAPRLNSPIGTYIKDMDGDFNYYIGNWVWTNNDEKIIFKFKKLSQTYKLSNQTYQDVIVGDYIYTTNYGQTTIVDTNLLTQNSNNPYDYKMFSLGPSISNPIEINFGYEDIGIQKNTTGIAEAIFTKIPGTTNQMSLVLKNPSGPQLMFPGDAPPNFNFSLPSSITLTKQP